jgi:glucose/arabinose dehydrogenase
VARRLTAIVIVVLLLASCAGGASSAAATTKLVSIGAGLRGPSGLTASVTVKGLTHVSALATDDQGRLWAATAEYEDHGTDAVYLVPSTGATPIRVIAGLHTPLGLLWLDGSLYVSSHARVEVYEGFEGTSFASHRTIVSLPDGVGENNGLARAPSGRIWLGISAPCDACTPTSAWSASVVSFAPDGTDLRVEASGIRAPVGLAYFPGTSHLYVTMNQRDKLGARTPGDWLAVVRRGQRWGFPACYGQGGAVCTGVASPTAILDRHAAASGVAIVTGQLGTRVGTAAVVAEWTKASVLRVRLRRDGSRATGEAQPFLTGFKNPEPVLMRADGTLLVGDWTTGKVYAIAGAS